MTFPHLVELWHNRLKAAMSDDRYSRYRLTNMVWLTLGIYLAGNIHLSKVVRKLPLRAQSSSLTRRFRRFLNTKAIRGQMCYKPTLLALLYAAEAGDGIHLIIDGTQIGRHSQLVMVAVAHRRRALPIAWMWISRRHSSQVQQIRLLTYINRRIDELDPFWTITPIRSSAATVIFMMR